MSEEKETIEYFRTCSGNGVRLELISKKGNRKYNLGTLGNKKQDKLFFIRLTKGGEEPSTIEFPYSYGDQHRMMELVMENIIFPHIFDKEYDSWIELLERIKENRAFKDKKLSEFGG